MKNRGGLIMGAAVALAVALAIVAGVTGSVGGGRKGAAAPQDEALPGEARRGGFVAALESDIPDVTISEAKVPGRPIVLIDPGHGGRDPGASRVSGKGVEKDLTLAMARELRDRLAREGLVRVALTRDGDETLSLDQRAAIARKIGASLLVSIHMDSAANPEARGATVYSLSDVASDAEAALFAASENEGAMPFSSEEDEQVRALLTDLALREQMADSATLAERTVRSARGKVLLRPEPKKFADFVVLRRAQVPGILVEAGYVSNLEDEARLSSRQGRKPLVEALAGAIETAAVLQRSR